MPIIAPIVHLNGTSADRLQEDINNVCDALNQVFAALKEQSPNGRDYYLKPGLLEEATEQHHRRMRVIMDLQQELQEQWEAIENQR